MCITVGARFPDPVFVLLMNTPNTLSGKAIPARKSSVVFESPNGR